MRLPLQLRLRHFHVALILTFVSLASPTSFSILAAADVEDGEGQSLAANDHEHRFGRSVLMFHNESPTDESDSLYVDTCGWGTHDTCPDLYRDSLIVDDEASHDTHDEANSDQATSTSPFVTAVETVAKTVGSNVGVSVQQMLEPFAMVGPDANSSLAEIAFLMKYRSSSLIDDQNQVTERNSSQKEVVGADPNTRDIGARGATAQDDVDFDVVSYVPFFDFDECLPSHDPWEESDPWAKTLASAVEVGTFDSVESGEQVRLDWRSHDDARFGVVGSEDVIRLHLDTLAMQQPADEIDAEQLALASTAKDAKANAIAVASTAPQEAGSRDKPEPTFDGTSDDPAALVGSGAVIVTLPEVYLPFDLAVRDRKLRNLFPLDSGYACFLTRTKLAGLKEASKVDSADNKAVASRDSILPAHVSPRVLDRRVGMGGE